MIELRWIVSGPNRALEYRWRVLAVDASGGLCPTDEWGAWTTVPTVEANEAAYEDLIASGGIFAAERPPT